MSQNLPVILVSASDNTSATKVISELIDNEVEDEISKETGFRVWQLVNKYYTAQVHLRPVLDEEDVPEVEAEAHVIYLANNEGGRAAAARGGRARGALRPGAVRLALADCAAPAEELTAWALRARYELVPLRALEEDREEWEEGEEDQQGWEEGERGWARARAALHAHVWPGLRRARAPHAAPPSALAEDEESSDGGGADSEEEEERAVERAEEFAEALGALSALAAPLAEPADEHDEVRRERAEQLVAAFCRALGHRLHAS